MTTTPETIEQEILSIISDIPGFEVEEITPETNIMKDLEVDSIKAIETTVANDFAQHHFILASNNSIIIPSTPVTSAAAKVSIDLLDFSDLAESLSTYLTSICVDIRETPVSTAKKKITFIPC
jgi:hypothetical protein